MKDQKEIIAANEKIARFMGSTVENGWVHLADGFQGQFASSVLIYDKSWNELMPVIEKISITAHVDIRIQKSGGCTIWVDGTLIAGAYNGTTIDQIYSCVVRFIDWHNEQNP